MIDFLNDMKDDLIRWCREMKDILVEGRRHYLYVMLIAAAAATVGLIPPP